MCGYLPFSDQYKDIPLREQIIKGRFTYSRSHWASVSKEARKLVSQMLMTDPNKRITIGEIFKHPWMQVNNRLISIFILKPDCYYFFIFEFLIHISVYVSSNT